MNTFDLIVVGGGPAGMAAGIQARHMDLTVRILEKESWGGRICLARKVENFPGLTRPCSGEHVADTILSQAKAKGVSLAQETCTSIDWQNECFEIATDAGPYSAAAVVLACGIQPKRLEIPGVWTCRDRLFYAWRDLPCIGGRRVAVIGGGETAFDQACLLAEKGAAVTVLVRGADPRAFRGLVQEARDLGVEIMTNAQVSSVRMQDEAVSIHFSGAVERLRVDYVLVAIGIAPAEMEISAAAANRQGHGLYWAGDVCSGNYRQAAIAFGDGIMKAMMVHDYLRGEQDTWK